MTLNTSFDAAEELFKLVRSSLPETPRSLAGARFGADGEDDVTTGAWMTLNSPIDPSPLTPADS